MLFISAVESTGNPLQHRHSCSQTFARGSSLLLSLPSLPPSLLAPLFFPYPSFLFAALPSPVTQLWSLGSAVSSPSGVRGKVLAANAFLYILSSKIASDGDIFGYFYANIKSNNKISKRCLVPCLSTDRTSNALQKSQNV